MPVKRNSGIDGVLKEYYLDKPIFLKLQKSDETINEAKNKLIKARRGKDSKLLILVETKTNSDQKIKQTTIFNQEKEKDYKIESLNDGRKLIKLSSINYQISKIKKELGIS